MNFWSVILAFIPALLVLALSHSLLWNKGNRDLLLNKYENGYKQIDYECTILIDYFSQVKKGHISEYLSGNFSNEISNIRRNGNELTLLRSYDKTLSEIIGEYEISKNQYIYGIELGFHGISLETNDGNLDKASLKYSQKAEKLKNSLSVKIKENMKNPISEPFSKIWSEIKRPFT